MVAKKDGKKFILNGKKTFVIDGASANLLIVLARTSGNKGESSGLTLFLVDSNDDGIEKIKLEMADSRNYANINFNNVEVSAKNILGDEETGGESFWAKQQSCITLKVSLRK